MSTVRVQSGVMTLLETDKASTIEIYDDFGDLMALFTRHFNNNMWIFVHKGDPDWEATLVRLGYARSPVPLRTLLEQSKRGG